MVYPATARLWAGRRRRTLIRQSGDLPRIVRAAHHGTSVGFMQLWKLMLVSDVEMRGRVKDLFDRERPAAAQNNCGDA